MERDPLTKEKCPDCQNGMFMDAAGPGQCVRCDGTGFIARTSKPLACPFCGRDNPQKITNLTDAGPCIYYHCQRCACRGPQTYGGDDKALRLWNTRGADGTKKLLCAVCDRPQSKHQRITSHAFCEQAPLKTEGSL